MITEINKAKCNGCGECLDLCPMDVIRLDANTKRAYICYPEDCITCYICELNCSCGAIYVHPIFKR
jgi:NAD-dependent dihydropyrimidine dehydrogenase PreA subunit